MSKINKEQLYNKTRIKKLKYNCKNHSSPNRSIVQHFTLMVLNKDRMN